MGDWMSVRGSGVSSNANGVEALEGARDVEALES